MVGLADEKGRVLQVGHLERFNPAVEDMLSRAKNPMFIECNRIAPFKARATDVDVALDLMIHDLDIILAMVGRDPSEIRAVGCRFWASTRISSTRAWSSPAAAWPMSLPAGWP
jgi:predicted dehydrogenase